MTDLGSLLLQLARDAIEARLGLASSVAPDPDHQRLQEPGATFVTLMQDDRLRGCIGSVTPHRALIEDVRHNACHAAFRDPRFLPMNSEEWIGTRVEISLLALPQPLAFEDETDALAQLRPGVDGVIFAAGGRRATFLPQVWEQLPEPEEFMAQLKKKAGLPANYWGPDVQLECYEVMKWLEQ